MEKVGVCDGTGFGRGDGAASSSFFFGNAIGPTSPAGPPASGGAACCCFCCWFCCCCCCDGDACCCCWGDDCCWPDWPHIAAASPKTTASMPPMARHLNVQEITNRFIEWLNPGGTFLTLV